MLEYPGVVSIAKGVVEYKPVREHIQLVYLLLRGVSALLEEEARDLLVEAMS